ncbi:glycosyltransferase, partial [Paenarthrobacter sp. RAF9]
FQALSNARLVVVPSRHETFGLVAIDALATGTPVITFNIPCLREIVPPGAGWLVEAFDVDAFAEEIAIRYAQPGLEQAAALGREFATGYNWDALAAKQAQSYNDSLAALSDAHTDQRRPTTHERA